MKGWDKGRHSELLSTYDTTAIGRAKFLHALKEVALQYVITEAKNAESNNRKSRRNFLIKNELHHHPMEDLL
jgi:hypothetical protein